MPDGSLIGANGDGILYAPSGFGNFELTMQVLSQGRVNSGVLLRGSPADYEERWFFMQIRVEGAHCLVRIGGQTAAKSANLPEAVRKPGRIGLQIHSENSGVEFREIRVRPLGGMD